MNQIVLMGRLTRDPELRRTSSGVPVASFTLAVDRRFVNKETGARTADFIDCVAWRQTGENIARFFSKGQMCAVSGSLQIRDWTDKDGNKRKSAEVVVDNFYFTESKKSRESSGFAPAEKKNDFESGYTAPVTGSDFAEIDEDDGDLPF